MLKQIAQTGFNTIRLPYTNQLFDPASKPLGINYQLNPDLKGVQGLALMDRIVQGAGKLGLKIILDRHDPTAELSRPDKLVYSAHDYGPEVSWQQWFQVRNPADLAHTLPAVWEKHWAYLQKNGTAPVFVGEFGGGSMGQDAEGVWQRTLVSFLKTNNINYAYWSWNPDSGDTGGILQNDWKTINHSKLDVLSAYQWPMLDQPQSNTSTRSANAGAITNAYH